MKVKPSKMMSKNKFIVTINLNIDDIVHNKLILIDGVHT